MSELCTIQLHTHGGWHDVGAISLLSSSRDGWSARTYTTYNAEWAFEHAGASDAHAFSSGLPVSLIEKQLPHWPVFLIDMLPQGFGREELLRRMGLSVTARESADWPLLLAGAGNPIGNLRVKSAAQWLAEHTVPLQGFTDAEVAARGADFSEYLAAHGLFVAGSSGVQGEWPKLLFTRADDGLLYLDHTLPDERAREHYIVKFSRGADPALASIFQHEAVYMRLARHLGLRVHADLVLCKRALFIPRFDRHVTSDGVVRLGQESIATLTGTPGFGAVPSHEEVCRQLLLRCSDPATELVEYLKREVANLALRNPDNHARNTAVQRDFNGGIRLTPLFDFAPMYLHPEGIARRLRWQAGDGVLLSWQRVLDGTHELVCQLATDRKVPLGRRRLLEAIDRTQLCEGLRSMLPALADIADNGPHLGLELPVHQFLLPSLREQMSQLDALV